MALISPVFPPSLALSLLCLTSSSHSPTNRCVFLAAPLPFLQVLSISFWVSGAHYSVSAILVEDSWGWMEWVAFSAYAHAFVYKCVCACMVTLVPCWERIGDRSQSGGGGEQSPIAGPDKLLACNKNKLKTHQKSTVSEICVQICCSRQSSVLVKAFTECLQEEKRTLITTIPTECVLIKWIYLIWYYFLFLQNYWKQTNWWISYSVCYYCPKY